MPAYVAQGTRMIPEEVRARSALTHVDYADHFALRTPRWSEGAERWARAMFGDRPNLGERFIWRGLLALRLDERVAPDVVAGWPVTGRGDGWLRMATASGRMRVELVVTAVEDQVSLTTLVRYDRWSGRLRWSPLSTVHRALVPRLLRGADVQLGG
jgi:hypothetical protein